MSRPEGPQRRGPGRLVLPLLALVLLVALGTGVGYGVRAGLWTLPGVHSVRVAPFVAPPPPPPLDPAAISAAVDPTLVDVVVQLGPFGPQGSGTGIVLTSDGEILTSHHVIKGAETISVTSVADGLIYPATTLGYDRGRDIAVLQLHGASGLPAARFGDSGTVRRGDQVMGIGNANGAGGTPTGVVGTVTELGARILARNEADSSNKALTGLIAANMDVVPGHSGGALVDRGGAVVGVLAAASGDFARQTLDEHAGYAVPIADAMTVVDRVRAGVTTDDVHVGPTATLGVIVLDASGASGRTPDGGATVQATVFDSPARRAELPEGATITALDGHRIADSAALRSAVDRHKPGDVVRLTWIDDTGEHTTPITLADSPPN